MNRVLNRQGLGLIIGLAVQFLLGMAINLFVKFPDDRSPEVQWRFVSHNPLVIAHLIIGTLLVLGGITILVQAIRTGSAAWKLPATAGLAFLLLAWASGDGFVSTQADALSYSMAGAFLLALLSYGGGLYRANR